MEKVKTIILGAAGRDFHDYNMAFKDNEEYEIVAFTHSTNQNIGEIKKNEIRKFPPELAGDLYPEGIPIYPEDCLEDIIEKKDVDEVIFSYSDVSHEEVMHKASIALSKGASFRIIGPKEMMIKTELPIIAIDAVRTGVGKSQASQKITDILSEIGCKVVVVREPMPYGELKNQEIQRFSDLSDLNKANVAIEEREEYEKHIESGHIVYAGVNYGKILEQAEKEADIIIWEGGNNELPFYEPHLHFVLTDPLRQGHELKYHPGKPILEWQIML